MGTKTFPLVGGRVMRVTRLNGCGRPDTTVPAFVQVTTDGFVQAEVSANTDDGDAITVTNANGKKCVNQVPAPTFEGYGVNITFCNVDPDLFALTTGNASVLDAANGDAIGFRVNTGVDAGAHGFALEIWSKVPGVQCPVDSQGNPITGIAEASGYILFPFLQGGVLGDFTVENDAVSFVLQGAQTKDGAGWGKGPYAVTLNAQGNPGKLTQAIDPRDHLHVQLTYVPPPTPVAGGQPLPTLPSGTANTVDNGNGTLTSTGEAIDSAGPTFTDVDATDNGDGTFTTNN